MAKLMDIGSRNMGLAIRGNCGALRDNFNNCTNILNQSRIRYLHIYERGSVDSEDLLDAMFQTDMIAAETVDPNPRQLEPPRRSSPGTAVVDLTEVMNPTDDDDGDRDERSVRQRLEPTPFFGPAFLRRWGLPPVDTPQQDN
jgi:hypothetical protein